MTELQAHELDPGYDVVDFLPPDVAADLTTCDREPIHRCEAIQPHGVLFAVQEQDVRVVQVSENITSVLGLTPDDVLNTSLEHALGSRAFEAIEEALRLERIEEANPLTLSITSGENVATFDAVLHRAAARAPLSGLGHPASGPRTLSAELAAVHRGRRLCSGIRRTAEQPALAWAARSQ